MFEHCARINSAQQLVPTFSRWLPLPYFYRTRVRTWATLVSELTHWLLLTRVDWFDPGVWRCQLKTCWGCYCCWCWCRFVKFCSNFENMVWSRFWCWISDEISKLKFGQYFVADAWLRLWNLIFLEILKQGLVEILKFKYCGIAYVWLWSWSWCLVEICVRTCDIPQRSFIGKQNSTLGSVVPLAMFQ